MSAITDLILRLVVAERPSRDLDAAIFETVTGSRAHHETPSYGGGAPIARRVSGLPAYTDSVDAAASLVMPGWEWEVGYSRYVPHNARVASNRSSGGFVAECDSGRAIALCIAVLKSRAAQEPEAAS